MDVTWTYMKFFKWIFTTAPLVIAFLLLGREIVFDSDWGWPFIMGSWLSSMRSSSSSEDEEDLGCVSPSTQLLFGKRVWAGGTALGDADNLRLLEAGGGGAITWLVFWSRLLLCLSLLSSFLGLFDGGLPLMVWLLPLTEKSNSSNLWEDEVPRRYTFNSFLDLNLVPSGL